MNLQWNLSAIWMDTASHRIKSTLEKPCQLWRVVTPRAWRLDYFRIGSVRNAFLGLIFCRKMSFMRSKRLVVLAEESCMTTWSVHTTWRTSTSAMFRSGLPLLPLNLFTLRPALFFYYVIKLQVEQIEAFVERHQWQLRHSGVLSAMVGSPRRKQVLDGAQEFVRYGYRGRVPTALWHQRLLHSTVWTHYSAETDLQGSLKSWRWLLKKSRETFAHTSLLTTFDHMMSFG